MKIWNLDAEGVYSSSKAQNVILKIGPYDFKGAQDNLSLIPDFLFFFSKKLRFLYH